MRGKAFFVTTVIFVISAVIFLFDPANRCLSEAYGQSKPTTVKGWYATSVNEYQGAGPAGVT